MNKYVWIVTRNTVFVEVFEDNIYSKENIIKSVIFTYPIKPPVMTQERDDYITWSNGLVARKVIVINEMTSL